MKVLLDEDVPHPLARYLTSHEVSTVAGLGWNGIKNGQLIELVVKEGFEVFVTGDKNLRNQQEVAGTPFAVIVLSAINWPVIRRHVPAIVASIGSAPKGSVKLVDCGTFKARRRPWSQQP